MGESDRSWLHGITQLALATIALATCIGVLLAPIIGTPGETVAISLVVAVLFIAGIASQTT